MKNLNEPIQSISLYPSVPKLIRCPAGWNGNVIPQESKFIYVLDGGFVLNVENNSYFVRKGQMALLPEGKQHSFWLLPDDNMTMLGFCFRAEYNRKDMFAFFGCSDNNHVVSLPEKEVMDAYLAMTAPMPPVLDAPRRISMCSELSRLCSMYIRARIMQENTKDDFAEIIDYMHAHITEDIALETLADLMHYDAKYFSAKFKKELGVTPMKYFAQMRAKETAKLLRETDMSLSAVAASIGFTNVYYFKKFFEKNMGVRPERYKEIFIMPPGVPPLKTADKNEYLSP